MTTEALILFPKEHPSYWEGIPQDQLNDDNRLHIGVLVRGMATGPWNIPVKWDAVKWRYGLGTSFVLSKPEIATFDGDQLTRLVVAAHDCGVRVSISPCSPTAIRVSMWTRPDREGSMGRRHPTIEGAIHYIRTGRTRRPGLWERLVGRKA